MSPEIIYPQDNGSRPNALRVQVINEAFLGHWEIGRMTDRNIAFIPSEQISL